ncbi:hypothetical protein PHSC3_001100 [Chlamydiales bacterium STE3]|nr:hypothetical protein PHSC3_001100 [Chlamydiales bacterium STE3]
MKPTSRTEIDRQVEEYNFTDRAWLDTSHIQTYFYYLYSKFAYLGPDYVVGPMQETFEDLMIKDFSDPTFTLYPIAINTGNHWVLLIVNTENRTIEYYDSRYAGITPKLKENLAAFASHLNKSTEGRPFSLVAKLNKKLQSDCYQCGVWILYFLEMRIKNPEFDFNILKSPSKIISTHRKKIRKKILASYQKILQSREVLQEKYNAHYGIEEGRRRFTEDCRALYSSKHLLSQRVCGSIYAALLIRHYERIKKSHGEEVLLPQLLSAK